MAYEVTATRLRPRTFDQLAGQEFVVATLRRSIESGRIAHAYLFSGPRGVGKTSAARILAKSLNCPDGPSADGCEEWDGSEEIARGTALDVIEIDGASNTSVNDVRAIKDEVLFAPNSSRYKIYIIDEVHMLSNSAFNALLKTIEEPPPYIIFIFATTEIHKVPATIRSRCQQFTFRLIPLELIRDRLAEAAGELEIEAEGEALTWIAKEATGSLRDAYTIFDQVAAFSEGRMTLDSIHDKLGLVGVERLNALGRALVAGEVHEALAIVEETFQSGVSVERFVVDLSDYLRTLLLISAGITRESVLGAVVDRIPEEVRTGFSRSQLELALEIMLQTYRDIRYTVRERFDLEVAVSRLASLRSYATPTELVARIEALRESIVHDTAYAHREEHSDDSHEAEPAPAGDKGDEPQEESVAGAEVVLHGIDSEQVDRIIAWFRTSRITLSSQLARAAEWRLGGGTLRIVFPDEFGTRAAVKDRDEIAGAAREVLGLESVTISPVQAGADAATEAGSADRVDPAVEAAARVFRGRIVEDNS